MKMHKDDSDYADQYFADLIREFKQLSEIFKSLTGYSQKLKFWKDKELNGLLYGVDYNERSLSGLNQPIDKLIEWGTKYKREFYRKELPTSFELSKLVTNNVNTSYEDILYWEYISIVPNDSTELKILFDFHKEEIEIDYKSSFKLRESNYWESVSKSLLHKEYLTNQIEETENTIVNFKNNNNSIIEFEYKANDAKSELFLIGYEQILLGNPELNFDLLYSRTFGKKNDRYPLVYNKPRLFFKFYFTGTTTAIYKAFLNRQLERLKEGHNIQIKENSDNLNPLIETNQNNKTKLQWNSSKRVLYDVFAQLMLATNGKNEPVITNTTGSVAQFLSESVEGMPSVDVIQRELEKMRSPDGFDFPKKNRIVLKMIDSDENGL